ncbi:MAG TPA: DUF5916 domain-containing protein [Gemmatimonadaceae bacterium]|nr:DUF5916 domain-containing protein [Gemmatimonadaceae bacterium]
MHKLLKTAFALAAVSHSVAILAQSPGHIGTTPPPLAMASPRIGSIVIDGRLTDAAWADARPVTTFVQFLPREGQHPTDSTEVRFLYDNEALYIGARMFSKEGASGVSTRLVRRDQLKEGDTDLFTVTLDTFHDHLGRAIFTINPSGVRADALAQGGGTPDASWDPIWEAATSIDDRGWTAEIRIPLSQLRFSPSATQQWGLQLTRFTNSSNERDQFAYWRANEAGGASRFGHLSGLRIASVPWRAEVAPYVVSRARFIRPADAANPFTRSNEHTMRGGADLKWLVGPSLTLNAAINPDFGQVEVDPAVVNLSAFETFFPERRPLFIEGAGIFSFGGLSCFICGDGVSTFDLFYSRRIGRQPQGLASGKFVRMPESTTILGAAKLTGRTRDGTSVGILDALTATEYAQVMTYPGAEPSAETTTEVEPPSNYLVGRVKHDFKGGNVVLGAIGTSVIRSIANDALAARLARRAESGGVDWNVAWHERRYTLTGQAAISNITGDPQAITRVQRTSAHYFQRPDRSSDGLFGTGLDTSATSMGGFAGFTRLAKDNGNLLGEIMAGVRSPGFETNDISFLTRADHAFVNFNLGGQKTSLTSFSRSINGGIGAQEQFNLAGDALDREVHAAGRITLLNYWTVSSSVFRRPEALDDRLTRGGPVVRRTGYTVAYLNVSTDARNRAAFATNPTFTVYESGERGYSVNLNATLKPSSNILASIGPRFSRVSNPFQFVTSGTDSTSHAFFGRRYIFAALDQRTLSMDTRLNVTLTPAISLELYAQPFISSAGYSGFNEFVAPRQSARRLFSAAEVKTDGSGSTKVFHITPPGGQTVSFGNPDFNLRSLRGNAVFRWEYRPGSTLFLVWQQSRSDTESIGNFDYSRDQAALFRATPGNVFELKMSYWLGF